MTVSNNKCTPSSSDDLYDVDSDSDDGTSLSSILLGNAKITLPSHSTQTVSPLPRSSAAMSAYSSCKSRPSGSNVVMLRSYLSAALRDGSLTRLAERERAPSAGDMQMISSRGKNSHTVSVIVMRLESARPWHLLVVQDGRWKVEDDGRFVGFSAEKPVPYLKYTTFWVRTKKEE